MKLYRLSEVSRGAGMDTVARARRESNDMGRAVDVLLEAQAHYANMWRFRHDRERNKRYTYGDQWSDVINVNGKRMTEEQYLIEQGNLPLKNNLIRRLVRNVIGVWRSQSTEPTCIARDREEQRLGETMSTVLQYNMQLNRMNEVYARTLEEFLISGLIVHKKWHGWKHNKVDCWTESVQPNCFFIDSNMRDFRGYDVTCLGEIHDVDFLEICREFARTPSDYSKLAEIYRAASDRASFLQAWNQFGYPAPGSGELDFLTAENGRCRVIEVWRKEQKPRYRCHDYNSGEVFKIDTGDYGELVEKENEERMRMATEAGIPADDVPLIEAEWFMDDYWYYYYLTPFGDILGEGETPYEHKEHPYVFMAYPFIDGEIHSFVADVVDQQKYVNRLITLHDWIMRATAKGVLLVPADCIPKGMSPEQFAESWSEVNGVIVYTPSKSGAMPQQVASNSTSIGIQEMLNLQMRLFEDISGVNGALQGKPGYAGMSAALYNQQTQNATTSLLDLLDSFGSFTREAAYKDVKNIQQYYDQKKIMNIAGRSSSIVPSSPEKIKDVEFDLSIVPSTATPAYRTMANDFLMQIWQSGQIDLQQLLETGDFPFADDLLQSLKAQAEQQAEAQAAMQQAGAQPEAAMPAAGQGALPQ